jgi:hypothetical protein
MLRRAVGTLLRLEQQGLNAVAAYSSQAADYTLVLKTSSDVSKPALPVQEREVGLAAGVPLDTFKRKVR